MTNNQNSPVTTFTWLLEQTNLYRVKAQQKARTLLLSEQSEKNISRFADIIQQLQSTMSPATEIFIPDEVQTNIYSADTGTHIIPDIFKNLLVNIDLSFVIRPGAVEDCQLFVDWAHKNSKNYTIRGAGTWPFGGCVPLNGEIVLDLSYLDFMKIDKEKETLILGPGALFTKAKKYLKTNGFTLKQEITNTGSGTIAGWIVTGGYGLGSYKYGHVRESVQSILIITPQGELIELKKGDEEFDRYFGSEGQFGILAGVVLQIRKNLYFSKPYAFTFNESEHVQSFLSYLQEAGLKPTSVIYFDHSYIKETLKIEKELSNKRSSQALQGNDQIRLAEAREDYRILEDLNDVRNILVLEFDDNKDYQQAIKTRIFGKSGEERRINQFRFSQLSTELSHKLWKHRFLPVQMKQSGPSMLVSETILPLESFSAYQNSLSSFLQRLMNLELKSEGHLLPDGQLLIQSIVLADTRTFRHKFYFALVPLMNQVAHFFGATPYGIGMWNFPFIKYLRKKKGVSVENLYKTKKMVDPGSLINRGKFLNSRGRKFLYKVFTRITPTFNNWIIKTTEKRRSGKRFDISYPLEKLVWNSSAYLFPKVVPPKLKVHDRQLQKEIIAPCAECDSCEHVCPTSDVFGLYGPATPITRRKTAQRLADGKEISRNEALGFMVCTRCDNCTDICPTDIPLTKLFDLVEQDNRFIQKLSMNNEEKDDFINRFWQIMKESPLYVEHTSAEQKEEKSHLEHGLKILYPRGFEYGSLYIDPETCIHCGMCSDENACTYGARESKPRQMPELLELNCALCNACVNYCPQNKIAQEERQYFDKLIYNAADLDEKKYLTNQQKRIHDTTQVHRSTLLTEMADRYVTEDIIMEIDKESSTGQIPVSGMGQGDRHMGIGFDAERFSHFHIVGPAQNRLHEGDPDEELSVILGKREDYCKFDRNGNLVNKLHPNIKLMTPILYNALPLQSNGRAELALIKVAEQQHSLVVIELERLIEHHPYFLKDGEYEQLPNVVIPRVDHELIHRIIVNPATSREFLTDLWRMPVFEVEYHPQIERTLRYILDSTEREGHNKPLISGFIEISEYDLIGSLSPTASVKKKITHLLDQGVDILHIHGKRNKDEYFVTSQAVRAIHHYLMRIGRRHDASIIASGGIRLASDSQKTVQRGAEATLIDFAALLALDPTAYKAIIENKPTTESLLSLEVSWALKRLQNQAESRKVQILEVLGASGFKDIKKTVGEEGRLIDFHQIENRLQREVFENESLVGRYKTLNKSNYKDEQIPESSVRRYSDLQKKLIRLSTPHDFYRLDETNQTLYKRDFVWPGNLIESMGRMAAGDPEMLDFKQIKSTGLLGDGFDVMKILYNKDPMDVGEDELNAVSTALPLDKNLVLEAPWMFGGKSVGSIGLDTWRAHVVSSKELGIQFDTGEGGYPTCFFLNSKGEPVFFTENEIQLIKNYFKSGQSYPVAKIREILNNNNITEKSNPQIYEKIKHYPSLKPFHFMAVIGDDDEPYVSTELKTGLFGVTKQTIKKARRVVIAYSQGAKMGIGGHILAKKVNKLVAYLRGIEGLEKLNKGGIESLYELLGKLSDKKDHPLHELAKNGLQAVDEAQGLQSVTNRLLEEVLILQNSVYELHEKDELDEITFENVIRACESIVEHSFTSIISPFPFHNCYSIEDVKAFIDVVHMINPGAVIAIKVSPSIDIEFIATGLARISKDNTEEVIKARYGEIAYENYTEEMKTYARKFGMKLEIWLDGPRGGTGASPNIIKGQMGMHIEYAIPLIHYRLVRDNLRNHVKFMVSGGIRTYEDVIKAVALGADGVIWGTAPMVAIGCDRNRNCHDGCSRGIATSNLTMQKLRDVEKNTQQIINAFTMMQMQVIRALAALGLKDIRELRGRFDKIHWIGLKERVDHRFRLNKEIQKEIAKDEKLFMERLEHQTGQTNCGVAAINGTIPIPGIVLDNALDSMRNRGMDGVGIAKSLCFPEHPDEYAYSVMVKAVQQRDMESNLRLQWETEGKTFSEDELCKEARRLTIFLRTELMEKIRKVFLNPYFDFYDSESTGAARESYKTNGNGEELDYRLFGNDASDPGDIFRFFVRVKSEALFNYIENVLFKYDWSRFFAHKFPDITESNYKKSAEFLEKAEDVFVFDHGSMLTRVLYVSDIGEAENGNTIPDVEPEKLTIEQLTVLRNFIQTYPFAHNQHRYKNRTIKLAAVMSNGKNFATWKTAGREIPWNTPDAPNNIIHVRLATGSVVEQMNAHPFTKLHTALTHNGETTNYEALKQRVEQFDLAPLATTDTEVAALKFYLTAGEWHYPDWALFESFSPTTGDDLQLIDSELRNDLEQVQRVEFASSPDGPYQYLCLRHDPANRVTERVDLKDPADLRPNVTAFWKDEHGDSKRVFSMIASEEQALHTMLRTMDELKVIEGCTADQTLNSTGMISRYYFDEKQNIYDVEFLDRYGRNMEIYKTGKHYSVRRSLPTQPKEYDRLKEWKNDYKTFLQDELQKLNFNDFHWLLDDLVQKCDSNESFSEALEILTWLRDQVRTINTGDKAQSSLLDITDYHIEKLLGHSKEDKFVNYIHCDQKGSASFDSKPEKDQSLVIDAADFNPEGTNPDFTLAAFLGKAYELGWRTFIIYRTRGQRLISTAVMGRGDTDDVVMDVYGSAGEYFGAFMQGGIIRMHGNAQNFCGMTMHHGDLIIYGNAGKVNGYASKGGRVIILGNVVDRGWTNSVNDSRCQDLEVFILGSATKYAGESLMGGNFFFGGMHFDNSGQLRLNERPYMSTKMLGGASRGTFVFFDPEKRLHEAQYTHGIEKPFDIGQWEYYLENIRNVFKMANIAVYEKNGSEYINVDGKMVELAPVNFRKIVPRGGLKGYESH